MDLITLIFFILGFVLLIGGAELLVRGASWLAEAVGISPLVVGLTVVSFGTSAPELAVSVAAELAGQNNLSLGNIIGSNIANILLILGLSALAAPLIVQQKLVRIEIPLMIGVSVLALFMALDGLITRIEGLILLVGIVVYTIWVVRQSLKENRAIQEEYAKEFGPKEPKKPLNYLKNIVFFLIGLAGIIVGSDWLVDGAIVIARTFNVPEIVIGLTIVAVGTSLPELATSVVASLRGERDIAVGNVIGSNLFNILLILGTLGTIASNGVEVSPITMIFDFPVMIAVAVATLPIAAVGFRIDRWEGGLFVAFYVAYLIAQLMIAVNSPWLPTFSNTMLIFVIPLTVLTLAVIYFRQIRQNGGLAPIEPENGASENSDE